MNPALVEKIVQALLYEGYILYPYRPAVKNQQRWTFGGLYPRSYSEAQAGSDAWRMQAECVVRGDDRTELRVQMRFLHLTARRIGEVLLPWHDLADDDEVPMRFVDSLRVGNRVWQSWQEAVEREAALDPWRLGEGPRVRAFTWPACLSREPIQDEAAPIVGLIVREQEALAATVQLSAERAGDGFFKVRVQIENAATLDDAASCSRDEALMCSLVSTHAVLQVEHGEFISLLEPIAEARALAESCRNIGVWPVLVGEPGARATMLAAPIILYDYPQIAPQSPGDLFDGTEIDEILSLRIMTLSEDERRQAAAVDERVRALLARTETLGQAQLAALHGVMRPVAPGPRQEET